MPLLILKNTRLIFLELLSTTFLKWSDLNRDTSIAGAESTKTASVMQSLETLISLSPGQHFVLPKSATPLKTYVFLNEGQDWATNPPVVKAEKWLLAGKHEPILVDQNSSFALKYLGREVGWTLVNV